ncbi:MAG: hypothetical protein E3J72_08735 [Planctomycetota bacterium]|nr:MAG: hypothetical protein E3J72_08735 [Planctomycetota bacterium]
MEKDNSKRNLILATPSILCGFFSLGMVAFGGAFLDRGLGDAMITDSFFCLWAVILAFINFFFALNIRASSVWVNYKISLCILGTFMGVTSIIILFSMIP